CALCLGTFPHNFSNCNTSRLHNGAPTRVHRDRHGKLIGPNGPICIDFQRGRCTSKSHDQNHECS
ncbi:hypothetical protein C8J56DRAFT_743434, partial [Mycena floridula]